MWGREEGVCVSGGGEGGGRNDMMMDSISIILNTLILP